MTRYPALASAQDGGAILAVDGGMPWDPARTELQLTYGSLVVDRYALSAADITDLQTMAMLQGAVRVCLSSTSIGASARVEWLRQRRW